MSYSGRALACVLPFSISQPSEALNIMRRILQVLTAAMLVMTVLHRKCGSDLRGSAAASKDGGHWRGIARGHDGWRGCDSSVHHRWKPAPSDHAPADHSGCGVVSAARITEIRQEHEAE